MLVLKILATIFISFSVFTGIIKNAKTLDDNEYAFVVISVYSVMWRALVIVALWVI